MDGLQIVIVTPESTVFDEKAEFVALPLIDGEIGVLVGHAPTIGRLGFGEMRVRNGSTTTRFYVDGGFMQIADNVVSVLTGNALPVSSLKRDAILTRLKDAETKSASARGPELALLKQAISQAQAQLRILERV
jgi:F-type H+-transporting ATPase subunit epsilon